MASDTTNYLSEAGDDACDMAENFVDEIVEMLCDDGKASDDVLNDYPSGDSYHHESHVYKSYSLLEAATLLDQLDDYEETDSGLWKGLEPRRAVEAQAAYTYGNAVYSMFRDIIDGINEDPGIEELHEEYLSAEDEPIPVPDPAAMDGEDCICWLSDRNIDIDDDAPDADDVGYWRDRVREAAESLELPKRSQDQIRADIKARVEGIIKDSR